VRESTKKKPLHLWKSLATGLDAAYGKNLVSAGVGQIYSVVCNDTSVKMGDLAPRFVGRLENDPRVVGWEAEDESTRVMFDAEKRAAKDKREGGEMRKALEPLRDLYRRCPAPQKRALLSYIISVVTS